MVGQLTREATNLPDLGKLTEKYFEGHMQKTRNHQVAGPSEWDRWKTFGTRIKKRTLYDGDYVTTVTKVTNRFYPLYPSPAILVSTLS